jgi:hypothetical protein
MTHFRLGFVLLIALFIMAFAQNATAQTVPLIVLTPDSVTGEVTFHVDTNTADTRLTETCIYRIDVNSPDPLTPVACAPPSAGTPSASGGVLLDIPVTIVILPEDQVFGARNIATVAGQTVESNLTSNSAVLPFGVVAPLFVVPGSGFGS